MTCNDDASQCRQRSMTVRDRFQQFLLFSENQRVQGDFIFVQDAFGVESGRIVQSAQRPEPRMCDHDVRRSLVVQQFPVSLVGRGDGYEFRVVRLFGVFDHEHHLSRFSGESFFCGRDDVVSVLFVIHVSVQHHDTRQLERVVQPADVPLVGLVGDRRYVQSGDVGWQSVVFEHRFVVFIMNDRPQRPVRGRFEYRVERQRFGLLQCECGPVVVQQDVRSVPCDPAPRGVLVEQRQGCFVRVGRYFEKCVSEQRFVECQFIEDHAQRFSGPVRPFRDGRQRSAFRIAGESFARDVIRFVVDDSPVCGRPARHQRQGIREQVVRSPSPVTFVSRLVGAGRCERIDRIPAHIQVSGCIFRFHRNEFFSTGNRRAFVAGSRFPLVSIAIRLRRTAFPYPRRTVWLSKRLGCAA